MLHNGAGECSYRSHNEHDIYKTLVPIFLCAILDSSLPLVHTRLERYPKDTQHVPHDFVYAIAGGSRGFSRAAFRLLAQGSLGIWVQISILLPARFRVPIYPIAVQG
jgi:hypothetical protein